MEGHPFEVSSLHLPGEFRIEWPGTVGGQPEPQNMALAFRLGRILEGGA